MDPLKEVKKKREFSRLPDSVVLDSLNKFKSDIKITRSFLRKYFGVFLTNKVLKGMTEEILKSHISSKERDYTIFYKKIFNKRNGPWNVIDLGCGVNGFSFNFMKVYGVVSYLGIEAAGQIVDSTNKYFESNNINGKVYHLDLLDYAEISKLIFSVKGKKMIFLFMVIDALEGLKYGESKVLLTKLKESIGPEDFIALSFSLKSLSGKSSFDINRKWLFDFLKKEFKIIEDFIVGLERMIILSKK